MSRRIILLLFAFLTALSIFIFIKRDRFEYRSFPGETFLYGSVKKNLWSRYYKDYPPEDKTVAKALLDSLPRENNDEKDILLLAAFLRNRFGGRGGVPSQELQQLTPLRQFQLLSADSSEHLWCGNWSNIFAFFCWSRGIPVRIVESQRPGDHHVFNECWVASKNSWGLVDLTNNIILPTDSVGQFIQGLDFAERAAAGPITAFRVEEGEMVQQDSLEPDPAVHLYYSRDYTFHFYERYRLKSIYSWKERVKRYLFPNPWYHAVLPGHSKHGNGWFWFKLAALGAWALTALALLILLFRKSPRQRHF